MKINVLFLQEISFKNDYFLKNLADQLANLNHKFLIFHEPVLDKKTETWFYTKRISAKLSESMVGNLPFCADTKSLFQNHDNRIIPNNDLFHKHFKSINVLVINNLFQNEFLDFSFFLQNIQDSLEINRIILFNQNPLSPLAAKEPVFIENLENIDYYKNIYPEEQKTFHWSERILPVYIANPQSFVKLF